MPSTKLPEETSVAAKVSLPLGRLEWSGGLVLALIALFFLVTSWRKWADPLVDFGIQLYTPWRILHGAVLYRDVDFLYGPLSQYFNAGLFACFGTHLMVLVIANLVVFAAMLVVTYRLFRAGWGALAAWCATSMFIAIFGFSQFSLTSNYNYATPYSHETTHGLLVCLLLVMTLPRWVEKTTLTSSALVGFLFGLTLVLKPEIILAAGLCLAVGVWAKCRAGSGASSAALGMLVLGALAPSAFFFTIFVRPLGLGGAFSAAGHAWLVALTTDRYTGNPQQQRFLGTDHLWANLQHHVLAALAAYLLLALIIGLAVLVEREGRKAWCVVAAGLFIALEIWLTTSEIDWIQSGPCLPGLALLYLGFCLVSFWRDASRLRLIRLLLAVLATTLLARMFLNARLFQFGYYQAALCAIMVPGVMLGEMPELLRVGKDGKVLLALGTLALFVPGVIDLASLSQRNLSYKTVPVVAKAEPGDRLLAFAPEVDPTGQIVDHVLDTLSDASSGQTLLVLPQGVMLNFILRLPGPNVPAAYSRSDKEERQIVDSLAAHPPDYVVIISTDLSRYGITRFGERPNEGGQILDWVKRNYDQISSVGSDPLDDTQRGAVVLRQKAEKNETGGT